MNLESCTLLGPRLPGPPTLNLVGVCLFSQPYCLTTHPNVHFFFVYMQVLQIVLVLI